MEHSSALSKIESVGGEEGEYEEYEEDPKEELASSVRLSGVKKEPLFSLTLLAA
jgi:hypothetical protein